MKLELAKSARRVNAGNLLQLRLGATRSGRQRGTAQRRIWSAETCLRFYCWDDLSSQQHRVQRCVAQTRHPSHCDATHPCAEPLHAALPSRCVPSSFPTAIELRMERRKSVFELKPKLINSKETELIALL